jgi:hypothetical protein
MAERGIISRLIEYAYVALRLPGYSRVTMGPIQMSVSLLRKPVPYCACSRQSGCTPRLLHCISDEHQARALLSEVSRLYSIHGSERRVANIYHKGEDAVDAVLETVYSRVATDLARLYMTNLMAVLNR